MALKSHHLFDTSDAALPQIRSWIRGCIGVLAREREGHQFIQAVDELCANIIEHSQLKSRPMGTISIKLMVKASAIEAQLLYAGDEFDLTQFVSKHVADIVHSSGTGGLGIRLIKELASKVEYRRENGLNVCTVVKRLTVGRMSA